jgi:hypothetical protein
MTRRDLFKKLLLLPALAFIPGGIPPEKQPETVEPVKWFLRYSTRYGKSVFIFDHEPMLEESWDTLDKAGIKYPSEDEWSLETGPVIEYNGTMFLNEYPHKSLIAFKPWIAV